GSRNRRAGPAGSRTPGVRPPTPRDRAETEARLVRGGAPYPPCGTARRSRRAGRSGAPARRARAWRARPPPTPRCSQEGLLERQQTALQGVPARAVPPELERLLLARRADPVAGEGEAPAGPP